MPSIFLVLNRGQGQLIFLLWVNSCLCLFSLVLDSFLYMGIISPHPSLIKGAGGFLGGNFNAAAIMALYAYTGFEFIVVPAEEMRHPQRDIPRVLLFVLLLATGLYIVIQIVATGTFPGLATSDKPLADAARYFMGAAGGVIIGAGHCSLLAALMQALP